MDGLAAAAQRDGEIGALDLPYQRRAGRLPGAVVQRSDDPAFENAGDDDLIRRVLRQRRAIGEADAGTALIGDDGGQTLERAEHARKRFEPVAEHDAQQRGAILRVSHVLDRRVISAGPHVVGQMRSDARAERLANQRDRRPADERSRATASR
ncbi:hypothetical protein AB0D47_16345 [Streptomyces sp. NPDC048376]|uniref:hypothetical protein n=1 Tax=Streptomyces sp. NPDC048376 TaxID=3154926 RepID=UPI0034446D0A